MTTDIVSDDVSWWRRFSEKKYPKGKLWAPRALPLSLFSSALVCARQPYACCFQPRVPTPRDTAKRTNRQMSQVSSSYFFISSRLYRLSLLVFLYFLQLLFLNIYFHMLCISWKYWTPQHMKDILNVCLTNRD